MTFEAFCKVMSSSLAENKAEEVVEAFSVFDKVYFTSFFILKVQ